MVQSRERHAEYMREWRRKRLSQDNHFSGVQDHTNRLLEQKEEREKEFEEHKAYADFFGRPRQQDLFNPRPMIKGSSDDPLAYGETGTYICPIHGCPLNKRGCPVCNNEEC